MMSSYLSRAFLLVAEFEHGTHYRGPLYRAPFMAALATAWAPIGLAIAGDAMDELRALAERKTPTGTTSTLREHPSTQPKVGLADAILRSSTRFLNEVLAESWRRTLVGQTSSLAQKADLMLAAAHAMQSHCGEREGPRGPPRQRPVRAVLGAVDDVPAGHQAGDALRPRPGQALQGGRPRQGPSA
jgi:hypothetical protein